LLAVLQSFTEPSRFNENEQRSDILERVDNFKIAMLEIAGGATKANRIEIRPFLGLGQEHQNLFRDYVFKHP
jgi:hypothetical protein